MVTSLLDRAIYSFADVDRLNGLTSGTGRRWLEGHRRSGRFYEPILREEPTGSEFVTWGEMVEARLLAEYRSRDVPLTRLRPAVERLRAEFGRYPLAQAKPFLDVEGRELVRIVQEEIGLERPLQLVVIRSGQVMLQPWAQRFQKAVQYREGVAALVTPDSRAPSVVMDPERAFGQPAVRSVRTDVIAEDWRAGTSPVEIAELYDLSALQVEDAIRFELIAANARAA